MAAAAGGWLLAGGALPGAAAVGPSCGLDAGGTLRIALNGTNSSVARDALGNIKAGGVTCTGSPTVTNTDAIVVTGAAGPERFRVALLRGGFAGGVTDEGDGTSEIELSIDLGDGTDHLIFGGDLTLADTISLGTDGANLTGDDDLDVTFGSTPETVTIDGAGGADILSAAGGAVTGAPWAGAVTVYGGDGADDIDGGSGNDIVYAGDGDDDLSGNLGADTLRGDGGADDLFGGGGNDYLNGGLGADGHHGDADTDTLVDVATVESGDVFDGGAGNADSVSYASRSASVAVTNRISADPQAANDGDVSSSETDDVVDVERIYGSSAADTLSTISTNAISLFGRGGDDTLTGNGGSDILVGGDGDDDLTGGGGHDSLRGEAGADDEQGGTGNDTFVQLGTVDNTDIFVGGDGIDTIDYTRRGGPTRITADDVADDGNIALSEGDDVRSDVETLLGGKAADILGSAAGLTSTLNGGRGADTLTGSATGNDTLVGGPDAGDVCDGANGGTDTWDASCESTITYGNNDSTTISEDATATVISVLGNDTGAPALAVVAVSTPAKGATTLVGGVVTFAPDGDFESLDDTESEDVTFTYDVQGTNGTVDTATVTMTVNGANDAPVGVTDPFDAVANTQLRVSRPDVADPGKEITGNIFTNDTDVDGETLAVTPTSGTTTGGGTFATFADGSFVYTPQAGDRAISGADDSFPYTVSDGTTTGAGTVEISFTDVVWWVSPTGSSGGTGTSTTPFGLLSQVDAVTQASDTVVVRTGSSSVTGGTTLKSAMKLLGEGVAIVSGSDTLLAAGSRPTLSNAAGNVVTLNSGNTVRGLNIADSNGADIAGTGFGTLTVNNVALSGTGAALDLDNGTATVTLDSVAVTSAGREGIDLRNLVAGSAVTVSGATAITNPTTAGVNIQGSGGTTTTFNGLTLNGSAARLVATTGTLTLNGTANSIGATTAPTGNALNLSSLALGTATSFTSIHSNGGSTSALTLSSVTGGTFTVAGTGTPGSGGTIQNVSNGSVPAVSITSTSNVSLTRMAVNSNAGNAITTTSSSGLTLNNVSISNAGTDGNGATAGHGVHLVNVSGTITLTTVTVADARDDAVRLDNTNTNATLTVSGGTYSAANLTPSGGTLADNGFTILPKGSSAITATISSAAFNRIHNRGIQLGADDTATGLSVLTTNNNTVTGFNGFGGSFFVSGQGTGTYRWTATGNTFNSVDGTGLLTIDANDGSTVHANLSSNQMNTALNDATGVQLQVDESADLFALVNGNTMSNVGADGIFARNYGDTTGNSQTSTMHVVITNNTVNGRGLGPSDIGAAVFVASSPQANDTTCAAVTNNSDTGADGSPDSSFWLEKVGAGAGAFQLERGSSGSGDVAQVIRDNNVEDLSDVTVIGTPTLVNNNTCTRPSGV